MRDDPEKLVARGMSQGVVDFLEVVEIDQDQCPAIRAWAAGQRFLGHAPEQLTVRQAGQRVVERLVLVFGSVSTQCPRRPPGDEGQDGVQPDQAEGESRDRGASVGLHLGGDWLIRQVDLEYADCLAIRLCEHGLQDADSSGGGLGPGLDDACVNCSGCGCLEGGVTRRHRTAHAAVIGEGDAAGEAEKAQTKDRALEDRQVGRRAETLTFGRAQPLGEISTPDRRRDGHLGDDGRLGATLIESVADPVVVVTADEHKGQQPDGDQAHDGVDREQAGAHSTMSTAGGHGSP